ncbi:hypothetical protein ACTJJ7_12405 [Phyllobacterium sp. 22229]|uniref:Uncharacterized protein n=1 Tax=Agrobacterium radiobacter TaxID=362 RepID=A0ABD5LKP4_AGRRD
MSSSEKLIERCTVELWRHHSKSRYGYETKRSWTELAVVEQLKYVRAVSVVLNEAERDPNGRRDGVPTFDALDDGALTKNFMNDTVRLQETVGSGQPKLTARQSRILRRLEQKPDGADLNYVSKTLPNGHPYLVKASARDGLARLSPKGLCELTASKPTVYRITERGLNALREAS